MISIILPTYNEAENVIRIIPRLAHVLTCEKIPYEIIVVDDNSPDGTAGIASELAREYPVRVHVRKNERGLSKSVIKGFELAEGDICVVMDADLSHPVESIPAMINPILELKCEATVGSRYLIRGGFGDLPFVRKLTSKGAGFLAKGITDITDRTSGFMAIRKSALEGIELDPMGWKIVLEVIVKAKPCVLEVPIVFIERKEGKSKLGLKAQTDYLRHLCRLYCYRYPAIYQFIKFCIVGASGLFVDIAILVILVDFFLFDPRVAAIFAFCSAVSWNYVFNRNWTFGAGKTLRTHYSYPLFFAITLFGLGVRIGVMHLLIEYAQMGRDHWYVLASFFGIIAGTVTNFFGSKHIAFAKNIGLR